MSIQFIDQTPGLWRLTPDTLTEDGVHCRQIDGHVVSYFDGETGLFLRHYIGDAETAYVRGFVAEKQLVIMERIR